MDLRLLTATVLFLVSACYPARADIIDVWTLETRDTANYFPPTLGNGHTGVVIDVSGLCPKRMFQASVFNDGLPGCVSTIRPVAVPLSLEIEVNGNTSIDYSDYMQRLLMDKAAVETRYMVGDVAISASYRALRQLPHAVMAEVTLTAAKDADITVINRPDVSELEDISLTPATIWCEDGGMKIMRLTASYNNKHDFLAATVSLVPESGNWERIGVDTLRISIKKGESASLWAVAAECSTADFADPYNESDRQTIYAIRQSHSNLISRHEYEWASLWKSDIKIEGNNELATQVHSSLYNIYSSIRESSRRSIAPMGLTSDKYYGHIFWDADTWMLPVLAVLHPELARSMIDYRTDGLPAAKRKASAYGYKGAMFPWESDHRGEESTPTFALTGPLEHHVTADVARGAWLYYCVSADTAWLRSEGYPLLEECARFWVDRVSPVSSADKKIRYTVKNVVGADEYAIGVDGDAFTNAAASKALEYATSAAETLGITPNPLWRDIAENMEYQFMSDSRIIKEHAGYNGEMTKQADVELLAFPLGIMNDPEQIHDNIEYYSTKIDSTGGPAMSHSAMAVNYARMGEPEKAARLIDRSFRPNLRGPFMSLSETPGNNETYFMTAAGGLLQAIIFGYCGLEITDNGIKQLPSTLPKGIKSVTVTTPAGIYQRQAQ